MTHLFWSSRHSSMKAERYLPTALGKILLLWTFSIQQTRAIPAEPCSMFQAAPPCLPPCPQETSSCILAPFKLSPFLAVGSSYEREVQPHHLKEQLPWQESQRQGLALLVNRTSHHDTGIGAKRQQVQLNLQDPPAACKQKINHDRRPAPRMKSADSKSSTTYTWSQSPKDWGEPVLSQVRQEYSPNPLPDLLLDFAFWW